MELEEKAGHEFALALQASRLSDNFYCVYALNIEANIQFDLKQIGNRWKILQGCVSDAAELHLHASSKMPSRME